jgi:hypothetical protein
MTRRGFHAAETRGEFLVRAGYQHTAGNQRPKDLLQRSFLVRAPEIRQQIIFDEKTRRPSAHHSQGHQSIPVDIFFCTPNDFLCIAQVMRSAGGNHNKK